MDDYSNDGELEMATGPSNTPSLATTMDNSVHTSLYGQSKAGNVAKILYSRDQNFDQCVYFSY
jgi:hypothetical protein